MTIYHKRYQNKVMIYRPHR